MKISYTHIVGVESDEGSVVVKFRPQGSDSADRPLTVRVCLHSTYIHVNLSAGDKVITKIENGANITNILYGNRD
jgi:hypothetical protein